VTPITITLKNDEHTVGRLQILCSRSTVIRQCPRFPTGGKRTIQNVINRYVDEIAPGIPPLVSTDRGLRVIERTGAATHE
jgi:hypothetical protein